MKWKTRWTFKRIVFLRHIEQVQISLRPTHWPSFVTQYEEFNWIRESHVLPSAWISISFLLGFCFFYFSLSCFHVHVMWEMFMLPANATTTHMQRALFSRLDFLTISFLHELCCQVLFEWVFRVFRVHDHTTERAPMFNRESLRVWFLFVSISKSLIERSWLWRRRYTRAVAHSLLPKYYLSASLISG